MLSMLLWANMIPWGAYFIQQDYKHNSVAGTVEKMEFALESVATARSSAAAARCPAKVGPKREGFFTPTVTSFEYRKTFRFCKRSNALRLQCQAADATTAATAEASTSNKSTPTTKTWELDFCSRPILDERGKKVWELLICDPQRNFEYAQYFPNNKITSNEASFSITEWISVSQVLHCTVNFVAWWCIFSAFGSFLAAGVIPGLPCLLQSCRLPADSIAHNACSCGKRWSRFSSSQGLSNQTRSSSSGARCRPSSPGRSLTWASPLCPRVGALLSSVSSINADTASLQI